MEQAELARACAALPLFPLPRLVLMPRDLLPLHVFEPRYRALVAHCLAGEGLLGIATLRPGFEADYYGAPAVWPEVGVGRVVRHQPFGDGRCNIVLEAVGRARIEEEITSGQPFRVARVRLLSDTGGAGAAADLQALRALALQLGASEDGDEDEVRRVLALQGADLVDELARRLLHDPDERRRYVGEPRLRTRAAQVAERLAEALAGGEVARGEA